ncbi:hypothetical protein ACFQZ4_15605 [Catellatospora coxensis]
MDAGRGVRARRPGGRGPAAGRARPPGSWLCYVSAVAAEDGVAAVLDAGGSVLVPAHDRGPRGRAALVADSAGAVFGLWQRGTSGGAEAAAEPATMCWTEVVTWDEASAVEFYGRAFHWSERKSEIAEGVDHIEWFVDSRTVGGLSVMDERYPRHARALAGHLRGRGLRRHHRALPGAGRRGADRAAGPAGGALRAAGRRAGRHVRRDRAVRRDPGHPAVTGQSEIRRSEMWR